MENYLKSGEKKTERGAKMLYEFGADGMQPIEVESKNDIKIGTILQMNGYDYSKYVIVKHQGEKDSSYGQRYLVVCLRDNLQRTFSASGLKYISEKKDDRIQTYITDDSLSEEETIKYYELSEKNRIKLEDEQKEATRISDEKEAKGRILFDKYIPKDIQGLIVAEFEHDDSDIMTDYFSTHTSRMVILGYSKHKRDLFSEMRKFASKFKETEHLAQAPRVDRSGSGIDDNNKDYWHPSDEHREKYSMGKGFYLKASGGYSTGWLIRKAKNYGSGNWGREFYISLSETCLFD